MTWGDKSEQYRPDRCDHGPGDGCMWCCRQCNVDRHLCPGCGTISDHHNTVCADCEVAYALNPDGRWPQ